MNIDNKDLTVKGVILIGIKFIVGLIFIIIFWIYNIAVISGMLENNDAKSYKDLKKGCETTTGYVTGLSPGGYDANHIFVGWKLVGYYYDSNNERKEFISQGCLSGSELEKNYGIILDVNAKSETKDSKEYVLTETKFIEIGYNDKVYYCIGLDNLNQMIRFNLLLPLLVLPGLYIMHALFVRSAKAFKIDVTISIILNVLVILYKIITYFI